MKHKVWMIEVAYWVGLVALFSLPFRTSSWLGWLAIAGLIHLLMALTISVGNHRLFCHASFKTNRFWHTILALGSVFTVYGSPIQWAAMHHAHHVDSDTDLDPHPKPGSFKIFANLGYRDIPMRAISSRRLISDPVQAFIHRHHNLILLVGLVVMFLVSPMFFLNAFLPGLGILHLAARIHIMLAHIGDTPRDFAVLELLLPSGGEWYHKMHHEKPGAWRFGKWDIGAAVVVAIRKK